ncbi:MAG: hypothetical protein RXN92_03180 [Thermoplasmatales archaeon]
MSRQQSYSKIEKLNNEKSHTRTLRILIPTTCDQYTVSNIYSILNMFDSSLRITFFHVVPFSVDTLNDCIDNGDINYAKSVAEKKMYSFIKMMPKRENAVYDYKISTGNSKEEISKIINRNEYDIIALQVGQVGHYSHSIFDILEMVNLSNIPVIVFRNNHSSEVRKSQEEIMEADEHEL